MNKTTGLALLILMVFAACSRERTVIESVFPDGSPKRVCLYKQHGDTKELIKETTYYPGKKIQMEGFYKEGKRDGKWTYWYENGHVWSDGFFKKGKSDGKRVTYFENGRVRYEAYYKENQRVGKWRFFNEKGQLLKEIDYDLSVDSLKK